MIRYQYKRQKKTVEAFDREIHKLICEFLYVNGDAGIFFNIDRNQLVRYLFTEANHTSFSNRSIMVCDLKWIKVIKVSGERSFKYLIKLANDKMES